jgi:hypothetical protein
MQMLRLQLRKISIAGIWQMVGVENIPIPEIQGVVGGSHSGGKQVKQVRYAELLGSGHYIANDQPDVLVTLLKDWIGGLSAEKQHITKESLAIVEE